MPCLDKIQKLGPPECDCSKRSLYFTFFAIERPYDLRDIYITNNSILPH